MCPILPSYIVCIPVSQFFRNITTNYDEGRLLDFFYFFRYFSSRPFSTLGYEVITSPWQSFALGRICPNYSSIRRFMAIWKRQWFLTVHCSDTNDLSVFCYCNYRANPFIFGLSVAGGLVTMGIQGAVIGPMLMCFLIIVMECFKLGMSRWLAHNNVVQN